MAIPTAIRSFSPTIERERQSQGSDSSVEVGAWGDRYQILMLEPCCLVRSQAQALSHAPVLDDLQRDGGMHHQGRH